MTTDTSERARHGAAQQQRHGFSDDQGSGRGQGDRSIRPGYVQMSDEVSALVGSGATARRGWTMTRRGSSFARHLLPRAGVPNALAITALISTRYAGPLICRPFARLMAGGACIMSTPGDTSSQLVQNQGVMPLLGPQRTIAFSKGFSKEPSKGGPAAAARSSGAGLLDGYLIGRWIIR